MPIDFVEESAPKIDFVPDEQTPSLDRELEREDLRRQMREARAEAYGNKAIQGLSDIGYGISHAIAQAGAKVDPTGVVANMLAREGYQPTQLISPEAVTQDLRTIGEFAREGLGNLGIRPGPLPEVISKPVEEFAAENIAAIPEMAPQLLLGKFQPRPVGRLFQAQMGAQVPAAVGQLAQAETPEEAVKGALQVGAAAGFPALIELGQRPRLTPIPDIPGRALTMPEGARPIPKPEVTEPKPAVEEPLLKPSEPVPAAKEEPKPVSPSPVEAAEPVAETAKAVEVETKANPVDVSQVDSVPATENGGRIAIILPDGTAVVGGRIHADTWNRAVDQGVATDAALADGYAGFVKPDGTAWGVNGEPLPKVSKVILVGSEQPKPPAKPEQRPPPLLAVSQGEVKVKQPWEMTQGEFYKRRKSTVKASRSKDYATYSEETKTAHVPIKAGYSSLRHEEGHHIWYSQLTHDQRKALNDISETMPDETYYELVGTDKKNLSRDKLGGELWAVYVQGVHGPFPKEVRSTFEGLGVNEIWDSLPISHKTAVKRAIKEGKPVPAEVLSDYPDLAPKPPPPQPSAGIEKQGKEGKIAEPNEITSSEKQISDVGVPERVPPIITTPAETKAWLSGIKAAYGRGTDEARRAIDGLKAFAKSRKYWDSSSRAVGNIARSLGVDISHRTSDTSRIQLGANVVRLANQESLFHEVGHAILLQKSGGIPWDRTEGLRGEWKALNDAEWSGVARDKWDYWTTQTERYASLLNLYVKHNAKFQKLAPELYSKLERLLDESAPTIALFQEARKRGISPQVLLNEKLSQLRKNQPPTPVPGAQTVGETQPPQVGPGMGGAIPAEFAKGQGSPTAMKYRLIDQERQKRGLEPLSKPDRISDQAVMDKAIAAMDQNPNLPDQLIQELRAKPRAIEDWENHVLLLRKIELREEYHKAAREAMQAYADSAQFPERLADMEAANARTQFYSEKLTELEEASRVAGSARGRALRALRVMANEDFSLASLEMEKRAANNWRPLTPDERAELIKIADEHKAKSEELQKRLDELEKAQQDKEVGTVLTNLKAEVKRNPVAPTSIDLISGKIRGKLEKDPKADIRFYVRKIARFFVSQGTKERDVLVDQVHGVLSGIIPDLDRRTTMDLISGYGDYSRLPKDTVSVILRDLSGQMQQIAKLEDMMRGEAPLRSGQERRTPSDVERILQKQVEEQKKKGGYTVTDPETQLRTAQEAVQKRLQNQITDLELQIQTRQKIIKNPTKLQYDAKSNQLKARRDELKAVYDEIFAKPAKTEAERLAEWKERTKDRIDELKEFLAGTKQPKQKPTPVVLDKEALRIRFDLHTIERLWREKLAKEKRDQWTRWQKAKTIPAEVLNVSRALLTSFDFSAPGRQGIIIGLAHPLRAASALKPMFEAWRSEKGAFDAAEQIRNRNNAPLYEIGKLYLAEHGGRLSRQEEAYMSRWAAKIPGIRASERAYVTFLNRLRADSFDSMVEGLTANGTANPAELKAIANFINVATGRGVGLERSGTTLNTVFFAPRYVFSRFQFLAGQPLYKGTAATRKAIAKEYGKFLAGAAVVYALASSAGADVGTDPRSSDFGKIIIGNTRIDPMAGLNQVSTLVGRIASGETKPLKGRAYPIVGKVPYGKSNLLDVMMNFGRGKLSPAIGTGISLRLGKDVANQPFGVSDLPKSMGVPISWQDMYSAMREEGVPAGIAMGMLSMFGIGVNTYEQQNRR